MLTEIQRRNWNLMLATRRRKSAVTEQVAEPDINFDNGIVTLTQAEADAIYYTTDGTDPIGDAVAANEHLYTAPFALEVPTIKAIAIKTGHVNSEVASKSFEQETVDHVIRIRDTEADGDENSYIHDIESLNTEIARLIDAGKWDNLKHLTHPDWGVLRRAGTGSEEGQVFVAVAYDITDNATDLTQVTDNLQVEYIDNPTGTGKVFNTATDRWMANTAYSLEANNNSFFVWTFKEIVAATEAMFTDSTSGMALGTSTLSLFVSSCGAQKPRFEYTGYDPLIWNNLAMNYDATNQSTLFTNLTNPDPASDSRFTGPDAGLTLGTRATSFWNGLIGMLAIFSEEFTQDGITDEITDMFNATKGKFDIE